MGTGGQIPALSSQTLCMSWKFPIFHEQNNLKLPAPQIQNVSPVLQDSGINSLQNLKIHILLCHIPTNENELSTKVVTKIV